MEKTTQPESLLDNAIKTAKKTRAKKPKAETPVEESNVIEIKALTDEMRAQLNKPLPKEAVSQHPTKPYLSTIKAIYVVERLNEVFGIGKWFQRNEIMESPGKMKQVHSFLEIPEYGIKLDNFGGNDNADEGDAWKGAATDALTKMASYLGIGMDVFKGLADKPVTEDGKKPKSKFVPKATDKQKVFIKKLMDEKGYTIQDLADDGITPQSTPPSEVIDFLIKAQPKDPTTPVVYRGEQPSMDFPDEIPPSNGKLSEEEQSLVDSIDF